MKINGSNKKYGYADIEKYWSGKLSAKEMYDMEFAALEDPFLSDAMEGFEKATTQHTQKHLQEIKEKILSPQSEIISIKKKNQWWKYAAAACVATIIAFVGWKYFENNTPKDELVKNEAIEKFVKPFEDSLSSKEQLAQNEKQDSANEPIVPIQVPVTKQKNEHSEITISSDANLSPQANLQNKIDVENAYNDTSDNQSIARLNINKNPLESNVDNTSEDLQEKKEVLNDVVVVGSGVLKRVRTVGAVSSVQSSNSNAKNNSPKDTTFTSSSKLNKVKPVIGWASYQKYLEKKLNTDSSKTINEITVSMNIDESGTPENISIFGNVSSSQKQKIIKTIISGSKWQPATKDVVSFTIKVNP